MELCLSFPTIPLLAEKFVKNTSDMVSLSPSVNRQLVQALMRAYSLTKKDQEQPTVHNNVIITF